MDRLLTRSPLLAGLIAVWLFVLVGSLIIAFVLNYTDVREENFPIFSYSINVFALLVGGWVAGRRSGRRGWYYGMVTGLLYGLLVLLIGLLAFDVRLSLINGLQLAGAAGISAFGGMLGVGTKKPN